MKPLIFKAEWSFFIAIFMTETIPETSEVLIMSHYRKSCRNQTASQIIYNYYRKKLQITAKKKKENKNQLSS